eukprot:gene15093-32021_t
MAPDRRGPGPPQPFFNRRTFMTERKKALVTGGGTGIGRSAVLALARAGLPVDVVAFADEEGHYGTFLGSRSLIGDVTEAQMDAA